MERESARPRDESAHAQEHSGSEPHVGQRVVDIFNVRNPYLVLTDRRRLNAKKYKRLKSVIDEVHSKGSEVFGYFAGHKGFVLSVVSAAAFASGVVGIGTLMKRRRQKHK